MGESDPVQLALLEELRAVRQELREMRAAPVRAPAPPFGVLHQRWRVAKRAKRSIKSEDWRADVLLDWAPKEGPCAGIPLRDRDPSTIGPWDVDQYRADRSQMTTRRRDSVTREHTPPAVATVNREVMLVKRVLNHSVERKFIETNPIERLEDEDEENERDLILDEDGFAEIFGLIDEQDPDARDFALLTFDSGMRRTETLLCCWRWLKPDDGQIHIPAHVAKNGEARVTDLSARSWETIRSRPRGINNDLIFPSRDGTGPANVYRIYRAFHDAAKASSVRSPSGAVAVLHDLRAAFVILASRRGVPDSVVKAKIGHKDWQTFERYRRMANVDWRTAWEQMERGRAQEVAALARRGPQSVLRTSAIEEKRS